MLLHANLTCTYYNAHSKPLKMLGHTYCWTKGLHYTLLGLWSDKGKNWPDKHLNWLENVLWLTVTMSTARCMYLSWSTNNMEWITTAQTSPAMSEFLYPVATHAYTCYRSTLDGTSWWHIKVSLMAHKEAGSRSTDQLANAASLELNLPYCIWSIHAHFEMQQVHKLEHGLYMSLSNKQTNKKSFITSKLQQLFRCYSGVKPVSPHANTLHWELISGM